MQTYTFSNGTVGRGLFLSSDEKLGQVLLLGESGRGRTLVKVGLDRRNPAEVKEGGVFNAVPTKITIPPKEGKPEFSFFVLSKPQAETRTICVRINTVGTYTKYTYGGWKAVEGQPETVVVGHGAYGDAGRIGGWSDSLVVMRPGDVVKVVLSGGHKFRPYALVCGTDGSLSAHDFDEWEKAQAQAKAVNGQVEIEILYGMMSTFSFEGGQITSGIKTHPGLSGSAVVLGEEGRGRKTAIIPLVNLPDNPAKVGVGKSDGNIVLVDTERTEADKALVRIDTRGFYKRGHPGKVEVLGGNPERIAYGYYAQGDAGGIYTMADDLWVVGVGDVLKVEIEGHGASQDQALYLKGGQLVAEKHYAWKLQDALRDPSPYIAKNWCPAARLPEEWVGSVVAVYDSNFENHYGCGRYGLASVKPLALDSGWDNVAPRPYNTHVHVPNVVWVERLPDLVWQKPAAPADVTEEIQFYDLPVGKRVRATVSTSFSEADQKYMYTVSLPSLYGVKYEVTLYERDGKVERLPKEIGQGEYPFSVTSRDRTIFVRGEEKELAGEFYIEFIDGHIEVYTESFLRKEVETIKAEIEVHQALRNLARPLNLSSEQKRKLMLEQNDEAYGMPVDATSRPCPPAQATKWIAFHRHFPWPAFPKLYVLQRVSFRSLSEGKTFEEFRAVYMRKI